MPGTVEVLSGKLAEEGARTVRFFESLPSRAWSQAVYTEGEAWTVREILAHVVQTELYIGHLMVQVRDGHPGVEPGFDLDRFNRERVPELAGMAPQAMVAQFSERRQVTVAWVRGLTESNLKRSGRHPALGVSTLERMARLVYLHVQGHLRDIRRAIRTDPDA